MDYSAFFDLTTDLFCALDRATARFVWVNGAWEEALGYGADELTAMTALELVDPLGKQAFEEAIARAQGPGGGGSSYHGRVARKDGVVRWIAWSFALDPESDWLVATARDVTEQPAESRHFSAILSAMPALVAITGLRGELLYMNQAGRALVGVSEQSASADGVERWLSPRVRSEAERIREAALRDGAWSGETSLEDASGDALPVSLVAARIHDEQGEPEAIGTIARDLRARKRDEARVRQLRTLMSSTSDLIALVELGGTVAYINPAGLRLLGRRMKSDHTLRLSDFVDNDALRSFTKAIRPVVLREGIWSGELALSRPNEDPAPTSTVVILIRDEAGAPEVIGIIARDLSEQKAMEAELRGAIRSMSTPIIRVWEGVLALPVIGAVDDARASQMMEALLAAIVETRCKAAIIDMTGASSVDTGTLNHLLQIVSAASLLGSQCVLSGISPDVAQTVAALEVDLSSVRAFGTLQEALRFAMRVAARVGGP